MSIYELDHPVLPDWADYRDILVSGMAERGPDGLLELERTGPFVPPLSLLVAVPDVVIVITATFKTQLEASNLSGLAFQPVIKRRIVHSGWETWDRTAKEPLEYPQTGEPEDYILQQSHDPKVAAQIGELWELALGEHAVLEPYMGLRDWDGTDWFRVSGIGGVYVSERAKTWLEQMVPDWVSFRPAPLKAI